ncbi:M56 family metallopeptidase [Cohnella rhizosphaerae]|uniref:M56 family metallopeptidase n=1 Tax=Cohnella rhizosphaerae TaxID=1457232 RepID=A0A9X4KRD0_9BACL|nr:M56 family metallopeptidase [Cohnella rhizosphaerae]MDG0809138.1 M56 family metallopeptidase [Cohnella rhizosphaerae]
MNSSSTKLPRTPKIVLAVFGALGLWMFAQLSYLLVHQMADVPASPNLVRFLVAAFTDVLVNHHFFEIGLNALIAYMGWTLLVESIRYGRERRQWLSYIEKHSVPALEKRLNERFALGAVRIQVISHPSDVAVAFGGWRPRIVLSDALIARFQASELEAIVLHEFFHCKFRHPLQLFVLRLASNMLAFLPVLKQLVRYYGIWLELLADRFVICRTGTEWTLGAVLLDFVKKSQSRHAGETRFPSPTRRLITACSS